MTEEEKNIEMQVRISARLGVLKNLGRDKGDAASVAKIEEELEWLCSLFDCEKGLALTTDDIRLVIQAYHDTNRIEREAHGEGGLYEFSKTPDYLHVILMRYNYLKYELPQIEQIKSQIP